MHKPTIAFLPIARTTFDLELAQEVMRVARENLKQLAADLVGPETLITDLEAAQDAADLLADQPPDLLVIFQATFADSSMVAAIAKAVMAPLILWAVPEDHTGGRLRLNSFCGINLAGHALRRAGYRYEHIFSSPQDPTAIEKINTLAKAGRVRNFLREARLGRVGENPDGFETCMLDPDLIQRLFGVEVVQFDLAEDVFAPARQMDSARIDLIEGQLDQKVEGLKALDTIATRGTLSVYAALQQIAKQQDVDAFAVRCWPEFFTQMGCAACGAMSMLSDDLVPCSCEADVNGTITQLILQGMSSEPAFGTDMVSLDEQRDALVIWHCGLAPLSMADPKGRKGVTIHSNRKLPLLFEFTLKPGPVTIARLSEATGQYRLVIGRGEIIRGPKSFSGTSGLLKFERPAREILNVILQEGLEHHVSLTYGDHVQALLAFADLLDLPVLQLNR